jgi:hypothetical protein
MRSTRRAARKVMVRQVAVRHAANEALALGDSGHLRVMLVLPRVSSMKTRWVGSMLF